MNCTKKLVVVLALVVVGLVPAVAADWVATPDGGFSNTTTVKVCNGRSCSVVTYDWEVRGSNHNIAYLPSHLLAYDYDEVAWCRLDISTNTYSDWYYTPCPVTPPARPAICGQVIPTGVDESELGLIPNYTRNSRKVTVNECFEAIDSTRIPDVSKARRIVVIGSVEDRKQALGLIGKPSWAIVSAHDPKDWVVKDYKYITTGSPTVYIMDADGTVLHRQDDVSGLELALRRADPAYDPTTDPDLRGAVLVPGGETTPPAERLSWAGIGAAITALIGLLMRYGPAVLAVIRGVGLKDKLRELELELAKLRDGK